MQVQNVTHLSTLREIRKGEWHARWSSSFWRWVETVIQCVKQSSSFNIVANTAQYEQYEPQHQSLGYCASQWTPATAWAAVCQTLSPAVQTVFKPSRSLSSSHLVNEEYCRSQHKKSSWSQHKSSWNEVIYIALFSPHVQGWSSLGKSILNIHDTALLSLLLLWVISQKMCFMTLLWLCWAWPGLWVPGSTQLLPLLPLSSSSFFKS